MIDYSELMLRWRQSYGGEMNSATFSNEITQHIDAFNPR